MDFSLRNTALEIMDHPNVEAQVYERAYRDINRCNKLLGGYGITLNALRNVFQNNPKKSYTILDMGSGDGEMLRKIADEFKNEDFTLVLTGVDLRDEVIELARQKSGHYSNISFIKQDILTLEKGFSCDVVLCTLTMHHFTDEEINTFAKKFIEISNLAVIVNDLERSPWAYWLFNLFSFVFIQTKIARLDGLTSITKGFKKNDLERYAKALPHAKHTISWEWAFRYLWLMQRERQKQL